MCAVELIAILLRTQGKVLFTLDDPYIHLGLAEHLVHGFHYGLSAEELSAPSSSIIYPFLLAPLVALGLGQASALILCVCATTASALLLCDIMREAGYPVAGMRLWNVALLMLVFAADTNLVGVAFTGLEHSLQITAALGCILGIQRFLRSGEAGWPWLACAAIAPSLRYENASLWLGSVCVLALHKRIRAALGVAAAGLGPVLGFTVWLWSHGLGVLPSSVLVKLGGAGSAGRARANWVNGYVVWPDVKGFAAAACLLLPGGARRPGAAMAAVSLVCLGVLIVLAAYGLPPMPEVHGLRQAMLGRLLDPVLAEGFAQLALVAVWLAAGVHSVWRAGDGRREIGAFGLFVVLAHLAAGQMGWFCRYQIYALITGVVTLVVVKQPEISAFFRRAFVLRRSLAVAGVSVACGPFLWCTLHVPDAAGNIYDQQFQMHRFVTEFYRGPVAVNDIGWVSFENPNYVLDLWGLACAPARQARLAGGGPEWMNDLARRHGVGLAMIYTKWFPEVPAGWTKVATLSTGGKLYTAAENQVAFFATSRQVDPLLLAELRAFARTLPAKDGMEWGTDSSP
jgi:hypothetical protein